MNFYVLVILMVLLFIRIVVYPWWKEQRHKKITNDIFGNNWQEKIVRNIKETNRENRLIKSGAIPTEEDIKLYYKMYLKKWQLDHDSSFVWDTATPMEFDEFQKRAEEEKYIFLVQMTCDIFIGGNEMMRFRDYKTIVSNEENQ